MKIAQENLKRKSTFSPEQKGDRPQELQDQQGNISWRRAVRVRHAATRGQNAVGHVHTQLHDDDRRRESIVELHSRSISLVSVHAQRPHCL